MNKLLLFALFFFIGSSLVLAQSSNAVKWNFSSKKLSANTYEVHMTATVGGDYHIYAQDAGVEGPLPTSFTFTKNPLVTVPDGKLKESGKMIRKAESVWGGSVQYYEKTVDFFQVVRVKGNGKTNLSGKVEFMVCNEHSCLPPSEVEFAINLGS